jgi:predicted Zn-ribbon and HTH transcriptional regulator
MDLSLNEFVLVVVSGSMLLTVTVSVLSRFLHARAESRLLRARAVCRLCGNVFLSEHAGGKICHCPACDKPNLVRRNGRLG